MIWRRIHAEGCESEVRVLADVSQAAGEEAGTEILEFRCMSAIRPPRRLAVARGALRSMDDAALGAAYRRALPIGGDHYGRPGKRMTDASR